MTAPDRATPGQLEAAAQAGALDLEAVTFGLMHPDPGLTVTTLAEADQVIAAYRRWLQLCAMYPGEPLVPTLPVGDAWQAHRADSARYARDCDTAFGSFAHCYPYYWHGTSATAWRLACRRTMELFGWHFSADMPGIHPGGDETLHPDTGCCLGWSGCVLILGDPARAGPGTVALADLTRPRPRPAARLPVGHAGTGQAAGQGGPGRCGRP